MVSDDVTLHTERLTLDRKADTTSDCTRSSVVQVVDFSHSQLTATVLKGRMAEPLVKLLEYILPN